MNALSVARTLWRRGVAVDVLAGSISDSPVQHSRAARSYVQLTEGQDPTDAWLDWLRTSAQPSVVLPCSDEGLELIARHRHSLTAVGHQPIEANDEVLLAMLDKSRTYELARQIGVPAPQTITVAVTDDLDLLDRFTFPCAIKPVNSHVFVRRFQPFAKGARVHSPQHARRLLEPIMAEGIAMLLTEVVDGTDECCSYYSYLDAEGEPLTHFTKRKLRVYPTHFGLGTYHMTEWQPEVAELGLRFFQGVGLRGVGNVEFKRDRRDGQLKLIECNPRFTHANELVRFSGIDFGWLAYSRLAGTPPPPLDGFRDNIGFWFAVDDVRALRQYRRDGELSLASWTSSMFHRQCPPTFWWRDPRPSLRNGSLRAAALGRRLNHRRAGRTVAPAADLDPYDPA
ncbi:MAG: hypothetical protein M3Y36_01445 [Actinomycetota bacterium]|nr:hypothetical protein [Actinomycetota bacterium]